MLRKADVAIIGGGPAGSTAAAMLRKYNSRLNVLVLEREEFPRDHVGESQLPIIVHILDEMGVWDKVEAAGFPVKIGATYRWGFSDDLWNFEFLPGATFEPSPRPGKFTGQRTLTAFQVDRGIYDKILLDHSRELGANVLERTSVARIERTGDHVDRLVLDNGDEVEARWYLDCSGHSGILRRAMGVKTEVPTQLQNIAIWQYWRNTEWASSSGVGGTRILVLSLGYGWIWFIPLSADRTSLGLVVPAVYYKDSGLTPEQLYNRALSEEPLISKLTANATAEPKLLTTKDWSFVAERLTGENWFLIGESAGFADPILSAGMTLAHIGAKECAYGIMAMDRGDFDPEWIKSYYNETQIRRIGHHIRFADFWYSANAHFGDLIEFTKEIAKDAGLELDAERAWQWLGSGGFVDDICGGAGVAGYNLVAARHFTEAFTGGTCEWLSGNKSRFDLNLDSAERKWMATFRDGRINRSRSYVRGGKALPTFEPYGLIINALKREPTYRSICQEIDEEVRKRDLPQSAWIDLMRRMHDSLEGMVQDGWVTASYVPGLPASPHPGSAGFVPRQ